MIHNHRFTIALSFSFVLLCLVIIVGSFVLVQRVNAKVAKFEQGLVKPQLLETPVPGGPGFVSLAPAAFEGYEFFLGRSFWGTNIYNPNNVTSNYVASIDLPNGAIITKLVASYLDNYADGDLTITLVEAPFNSYEGVAVAVITSSGSDPSYQYGEAIPEGIWKINQQMYFYYFILNMPPSMDVKFAGLRVDYSYPSILPLVQK